MREGEGECGVGAGYLPDELGYAGLRWTTLGKPQVK
jgi:hypothetical protein